MIVKTKKGHTVIKINQQHNKFPKAPDQSKTRREDESLAWKSRKEHNIFTFFGEKSQTVLFSGAKNVKDSDQPKNTHEKE